MSEKRNIYQRLSACQSDVSYIQKEFVKQARHFAVSHDAVTERCREAFLKHGVFVKVDTVEREQREIEREYRSGKVTNTYTAICVQLTFVNIDAPEDSFSVKFWGDGEQADNKSPGAAYSFAVKTALLKTLLIPTGEQEESAHVPEREQVVESVPAATSKELDKFLGALTNLCKEKGWVEDDVLDYINTLFDPPIENWTVDQLRAAYNTANKKYQPVQKGTDQ